MAANIKHILILSIKIFSGLILSIIVFFITFSIFGERIMFAYRVDGGLKHAVRYINDSAKREIIFIPMQHLNTDEFYTDLHEYLDDMKQQGYVTFNEGVRKSAKYSDTTRYITISEARKLYSSKDRTDSIPLYELLLKERRILNQKPISSTDSVRLKEKWLNRLYRNPKHKWQNSQLLGTITEQDYWVDYTLADLMRLYETEWGPVILTEYDYATPMSEEYNRYEHIYPSDTIPYCKSDFISYYRNKYLKRKFLEADFPKIIVIYGADHIGIVELGIQHYGFRKDKDFKVPKKYR